MILKVFTDLDFDDHILQTIIVIIGGIILISLAVFFLYLAYKNSDYKKNKEGKTGANTSSTNDEEESNNDELKSSDSVSTKSEEKTTKAKKKKTKKSKEIDKTKYQGKYEIYSTENGFMFKLKASNGEVLVDSEVYSTKKSCRDAIDSLKRNVEEGTYKVFRDKHDLFHFQLTAKNNRVISISANYKTEKSATSAMESFKRFAASENIIEMKGDKAATVESNLELFDEAVEREKNGKYSIKEYSGKYAYILKAANGQLIAHSMKNFANKQACIQAIDVFKKTVEEGLFYIYKDKSGKFQLKLYNTAKRVVLVGEVYATKKLCQSSICSIKRYALDAVISEEE